MPAPSVSALRDFESQLGAALATILATFASARGHQLASHDTTDFLNEPRLEYEFGTNEPPGPDGTILVRPSTNAQIAFSGTLSFRQVFDHTKLTPAEAGEFRGALRTLLSPESNAFTLVVLPWLKIDALNETSSVRSRYKQEGKEKMLSEWLSTWSIIFTIREDAWPV